MESMYVSLREASQALGVSAEQLYRMGVADQFRLYKPQPFHKKGSDGYEIVESLIFEEDVFDEGDEIEADEDPENMYYFKRYGELLLIRKADFQKMLDRLPPPKMEAVEHAPSSPLSSENEPLFGHTKLCLAFDLGENSFTQVKRMLARANSQRPKDRQIEFHKKGKSPGLTPEQIVLIKALQ